MLTDEFLLQWFNIMIPYIPSPYQFIAKIILAFVFFILLAFAWHQYVAEPYREQGRAELRPKLLDKDIEINACEESSQLLQLSIENQNKLVQEYKDATKAAQIKSTEAIKKSQAMLEARRSLLNKAKNTKIVIKDCESEVDLAKQQLESKK